MRRFAADCHSKKFDPRNSKSERDAALYLGFAGRSGTTQRLNAAVAKIEGLGYRPGGLNAESTTVSYSKALFEAARLTDIDTRPTEISVAFQDCDDYWNSKTAFVATIFKSLSEEK